MTSQMVDIRTPGLKWWLQHLEQNFEPEPSLELFINALKRRSIRNPTPVAIGAARLLLRLIAAHPFKNLHMVVSYVLSLESKLSSACPREMSIRNMVRRVLGIIREEAENQDMGDLFKTAMEADEERQQHERLKPASRPPLLAAPTSFAVGQQTSITSLFHVLSQANTPSVTGPSSVASSPTSTGVHTPVTHNFNLVKEFRPAVIQDIQELIEELASSESAIAEYAPQLIHKNELILTYGLPPTVHHLLLRAAQKKGHDFTAVVVEGSPNTYKRTHGAVMNVIPPSEDDEDGDSVAARKSLQERGIQVIVISDADVYNFVGRVNKVFLAANYVLADGSVLATSGALNVARAAKAHQKPVLVVAGSHVLCPVTSFYQEILIEMGAPVTVGYDEGYLLENAEFPNPLVDFIPSELVTMFVTNNGIVSKTTISRATLDLYHMPEADLV